MGFMSEYERWLQSPAVSEGEKNELLSIKSDTEEIKSRFYAPLEFGTAGLRGIMGAGINRMNAHVIRQATQGMAALIEREGKNAMKRGVVICHDCRNRSREFALEAASVMAANGIFVRVFEDLRPTPELSFAIREYGAVAGINVTASHNPKEYNGYKVYWEDGAQLPPEHAAEVLRVMESTDIFTGAKTMPFQDAIDAGLAEIIGAEIDERFLTRALEQAVNPEVIRKAADTLKIVYTPFHGAGYLLVPEILRRAGVKTLVCVEEQMIPDGDFPTVKSPNPEEAEGFALALKTAEAVNADIIIGTDPDADRIALMARRADGSFGMISGNQLGVLLLDYIITAKKEQNTLPKNAAALKTIVSTGMANVICAANGVAVYETFTGFKFMAERIKEFESTGAHEVVFSFEESIGYLVGSFVRDKDAVTTSLLACEMTSHYALLGMTLFDALEELYAKYGRFAEKTVNLVMPGLDGLEKMRKIMRLLREKAPAEFGGLKIVRTRDYLSGRIISSGVIKTELQLKGSDVLFYELEDGSAFIVRPSGTEPKIKVYILVRGSDEGDCAAKIESCALSAEGLIVLGEQ